MMTILSHILFQSIHSHITFNNGVFLAYKYLTMNNPLTLSSLGLRKVTKDMQTHKNPELRASSVVKATDVKKGTSSAPKYGSAAQTKKPPVCELQGKKWIVVCSLSSLLSFIQLV